jgi:hypothetical protein
VPTAEKKPRCPSNQTPTDRYTAGNVTRKEDPREENKEKKYADILLKDF